MNPLAKPIAFIEHVFFKVAKDTGIGYIYKKFAEFRYGVELLKIKDKHFVMSYPILIVIAFTICLWILVEHALNINKNWFTVIYGYIYSIANMSYTLTFYYREQTFQDLSITLDKWWDYKFLEEKQEEIKKKSEQKMDNFDKYYYPLMKLSGVGYAGLHTLRSIFTPKTSLRELLIFRCWYPIQEPWGFALTFSMEAIIMITLLTMAGRMVTYMYSSFVIIGSQYKLAGLSLLTIEERVSKMMKRSVTDGETEYDELYLGLMQQEIRNTVMHMQSLRNSAKITCKLFEGPINMYYYPGLMVTVLATIKLMSDWNDKFEVMFTFILAAITVFNLFLICFINEILQDELENLRFTVYACPWKDFPASIKKSINIIQSMLLKNPTIQTLLRSKTDMEFFGTVFNAYYCFINAGRTMNITY